MKYGPARQVGDPQPGFFQTRLVKKGPKVPARISYENGIWQATINGETMRADADPTKAPWVFRIWEGSEMITEECYNYLLALKDWALKHDPTHPAANPRKPIDLNEMNPLWS